MSRQTALHSVYADQEGVKLVDFGGWEMPLNFHTGIINEHNMVRTKAGLFDVSHMGEFILEGPDVLRFADYLVTNRNSGKRDGRCIYSPMCMQSGGTVDDVMIYKISDSKIMIVVNAANIEKDKKWIKTVLDDFGSDIRFQDISASISLLALQGPSAADILAAYCEYDVKGMRPFSFVKDVMVAGLKCLVSRTGYTGEDGFEIYLENKDSVSLWKLLLHDFSDTELCACGLGARDTLRLEACLSLYGNELSDTITPVEAGLSVFIKFDKDDFIGKKALQDSGQKREILACEMTDRGVPRHGNEVFIDGCKTGEVTSGSKSPTLDKFIALVLVENGKLKPGDSCVINCGGKDKKAEIISKPFYRREK